MTSYDFVAIGDITIDAFIRVKDARVTCDINDENCTICVRFGDKIPFEFDEIVAGVGNSPNAAASAAKLGLNAAVSAAVGDDKRGEECIQVMKDAGVSAEFIEKHKDIGTNYHYVLWYENDRTIFVQHHEYPRTLPTFANPPKWIYLSSLAKNTESLHHEIASYVKSHPETKLAFQPGTFQMSLGTEMIKDVYEATEIFFCNKEEAQRILNTPGAELPELLKGLHALGPKIVVITEGPKGATTFDGTNTWFMPMYPDLKPPYERTGAGDAFASTVTAALALGKPLEEALTWGPINSMSVVQFVGAQKGQLSREKLEEYLKSAPPDYSLRKI
jgi:sugar/nucleoside kinase (ribokinase family)